MWCPAAYFLLLLLSFSERSGRGGTTGGWDLWGREREMRILVCGGRYFTDYARMDAVLSKIWVPHETVLIHGDARGADRMAEEWLHRKWPDTKHEVERFPADWAGHGVHAGPIRNHQMIIDGKPDLVVVFPGGRGTADMVRRAKAAGIKVMVV
jgi:hypothetical protein